LIEGNYIQGLGVIEKNSGLSDIQISTDGLWKVNENGVNRILTPIDKKVEFIVFEDKTLTLVKSSMGHPAYYPIVDSGYTGPAKAILMDLDGTSVISEKFWMWIIERSIGQLMGDPDFSLEPCDEIHVSGHSVSEHLKYCINKYCQDKSIDEARRIYHKVTKYEVNEIVNGRGQKEAFVPRKGLKEFLLTVKAHNIKIGLVTSGLYNKAWPEILSAFKTMEMGEPLEFYDAIITAGQTIKKGQTGTLGELTSKPHPWLYAETARIGLGISSEDRDKVIGIEDSSAGVLALRLAGFSVIGLEGGNILESGIKSLTLEICENLKDVLPVILNK
jgi:beta-phosphoglucomutase